MRIERNGSRDDPRNYRRAGDRRKRPDFGSRKREILVAGNLTAVWGRIWRRRVSVSRSANHHRGRGGRRGNTPLRHSASSAVNRKIVTSNGASAMREMLLSLAVVSGWSTGSLFPAKAGDVSEEEQRE